MRSLLIASVFVIGCGGSHLPSLSDIETAPQHIQNAGTAVVRIQTAGASATGTFISGNGLLLTNNHVLGTKVCPLEGCFFRLTFKHQLGVAPSDSVIVFGVPAAADVGRDVALIQVFTDATSGQRLGTADFLTPVDSATAESLKGTSVYVVGHPEGRLKKWTQGTVVDSTGDWFETTSFILPGSSGSPVLNENGELVGIVHRSPTGEDLISSTSYDASSLGTSAEAIHAVGTLPAVMLSTQAMITADDLVTNNRVYLNARASTANVGGQQVSVLDALGTACDAALARTDFQSPEDLTAALQPCNDGELWIECRSDVNSVGYGTQCPTSDAAQAWTARYQKMNSLYHQLYGGMLLTPLSFGVAALSTSRSAGITAGAAQLQMALGDASPPLDFNIDMELSAFAVTSWQGHDIISEVESFGSSPGHALFGTTIATAALWLKSNALVTDAELASVLNGLLGDPDTSVGTRLYVEDAEYLRKMIN
jgi:V8-like Glu-specific endopeptidase